VRKVANKKLSKEEFVKKAIQKLRKGEYKGIHTVFSRFNEAFRKYFDGADPVEATKELVKKGIIVSRPARRGAYILLAEDATDNSQKVLDKILE